MKTLSTLLCVAALVVASTGTAHAALALVTSSAALDADYSIDWSQFGARGTVVSSGAGFTSTPLGITGTVTSETGGDMLRATQGVDWNGNFATGSELLWSNNAGPFTMAFGAAVFGGGAYVQANFYGPFTAQIEAFNGVTSLGTVTAEGVSGADPGTALFIGVVDSTADVTKLVFSLTSAASSPTDFSIDTLLIDSTGPRQVPAPGTIPLVAAGLAGVLAAARRRRPR